MQQAERGMQELLDSVDTMIVIPNEKLLAVAKDAGFFESFRIADDVLRQGVQGISDIITIPGIINRDFADVKTTMAGMGYAVMGTAVRSGVNRAIEAAQAAMASPLLEAGAIDGAKGILINISGSSSLKLSEVNEASTLIQNAAHEDANIIFGAVLDERMGDEVKITVIATGFRQGTVDRKSKSFSGAVFADAAFTDVPPVPVQARPAKPRFASEVAEEEAAARPSSASKAAERKNSLIESGSPGENSASSVFGAGAPAFEEEPSSFLDAFSVAETDRVVLSSVSESMPAMPELFTANFLMDDEPVRDLGAGRDEEFEHLDIPAFMRQGGR
jgi:cell division protein FtsZ